MIEFLLHLPCAEGRLHKGANGRGSEKSTGDVAFPKERGGAATQLMRGSTER